MTDSHSEKLRKMSRELGLLRSRDLNSRGIPRTYLKKLVDQGQLLKTGRGLYMASNFPLSENHSFAEAIKLVPNGTICLLSALRFHNLTEENPDRIWIALNCGARKPKFKGIALQVHWFSEKMKTEGIENHEIEGINVPIYSVAKTVADCFRFRNRIGISIAVQALQEAWRNKKATPDELWKFAEICRVLNVMRPYFNSLQ